MPECGPEAKPMPTIWRVPDELWEKVEPILKEHDPPKSTGRSRIDQRAALDAIIFRLRTGCQWNRLPEEFPDDSSVHRTLQRWLPEGMSATSGACAARSTALCSSAHGLPRRRPKTCDWTSATTSGWRR